jgi:hypothetical protein
MITYLLLDHLLIAVPLRITSEFPSIPYIPSGPDRRVTPAAGGGGRRGGRKIRLRSLACVCRARRCRSPRLRAGGAGDHPSMSLNGDFIGIRSSRNRKRQPPTQGRGCGLAGGGQTK